LSSPKNEQQKRQVISWAEGSLGTVKFGDVVECANTAERDPLGAGLALRLRRGRTLGVTEYNDRVEQDIAFYKANYDIIFDEKLSGGRRISVSDPVVNGLRRCRFCGRSQPLVHFRKKAHAIPEFLGNKRIFLKNECDECNSWFSVEVEDHLAKWFGPLRTLCRIHGKRGVPSHKSPDGRKSIEFKNGCLTIDVGQRPDDLGFSGSNPLCPFDMKLAMPTQSHIPLRAAKCLVKAACSILPTEELRHFVNTMKWVRMKESPDQAWKIITFTILCSFTPGPRPFGDGVSLLLRRKPGILRLPYMLFVIATANFILGTLIPFCSKDLAGSVSYKLHHFPVVVPKDYRYGLVEYSVLDWASTSAEVVDRPFVIHIEKAIEVGKY